MKLAIHKRPVLDLIDFVVPATAKTKDDNLGRVVHRFN